MIEEMLAHIYVAAGPQAMQQAQEHFKSQSPSQVRIIYRVFLDKKEKEQQYRANMVQIQQGAVMNQAKLNLMKAQAYRDHLKREFDMTMHIKKQELEVLKSANAWMRRGWGYGYGRPGHVHIHQTRRGRFYR